MTTSTTKTSSDCIYDGPKCVGEIWQCLTCKERYCQFHAHSTAKGANVECPRCERARKEAELPDIERALGRIHALSAVSERLDITDKPDYHPGK